jgi:LmbE family N-acetylglucosaminyl deacetylase
MAHIFLSPHMDDAVLSCGGLIYRLAQAGEPVTVFSVMAGRVPPDVPISPFIEEHFRRWKLWPDPVPGRQAEDTRAVQALGAHVRFGDIPDVLYRTDGHGTPLCPDLSAMFGEIDPRDPALARMDRITGWLDPAATIYAPLGAGHHVDHRLVRKAVLRWAHAQVQTQVAVLFYEEYPYSARGPEAVQAALAGLIGPPVPVVQPVSDQALDAKIQAIACYESQISTFWDDRAEMAESVRQYAALVGQGHYAERLWLEREKNHE